MELSDLRQKCDQQQEQLRAQQKEEISNLRTLHVEEIKRKTEELDGIRKMYESKLTEERENERNRGKEAQQQIETQLEKMTNEKKEYESQFLESQKQLRKLQEKIKELEKNRVSIQVTW